MAVINKLLVSGIRSFGPDEKDSQLIEFKRPLTLILGENGCGKTTIIESLKFALCGELPPNSNRGQSFVHDPKVNKTREVLGQIRLQFTSPDGKEFVVSRSVQAQLKKKDIAFKTIDSSLKIMNKNDKNSDPIEISGRCGETDATLASILGVSKAILNNVIFCHQEDSNWPLEGGKKLKERFDAIFDATKYNKCFENIRKIRKQYSIDIKILEQDVKYMSERKQEYDKKKLKIVEEEEKINDSKKNLSELEKKLQPIRKRLEEIANVENNIVQIKTQREKAKARLENCVDQQSQLKKNIKSIYVGSDEELKNEIKSFASNLQQKEKQMDEVARKLNNLKRTDVETGKKITSSEIKKSELFTLEGQNQEKVALRNTQLEKAAEFVGIDIQEDLFNESETKRLVERINDKGQTFSQDLKQLQDRCDAEEKELQKLIDNCRDASARHKQKILIKKQECNDLGRKIEKLNLEISLANESKNKLKVVQEDLEKADRNLESITSECDVKALQETINTDDTTVSLLERELEQLDQTIHKMQQQSSKLTEINLQKEALATKEKTSTRCKNKNRDTMMELMGGKLPEKNFKATFQKCQEDLKAEANMLNKKLKEKQHEITSLQSKRVHQKEELSKKKLELSSAEDQMYRHCGKMSLEDKLAKLDAEIEALQDQKMEVSSFEFVRKKFVEKLKEENPCCPLCHRGFEGELEVTELVSELNDTVRNVPRNLDNVLKNLSKQSALRDQLVSMRPLDKRIKTLKDEEISALESALDVTEKSLQEAHDEADELQMSVAEPERKLADVATMLPDLILLDQTLQEITFINKEIQKLESHLDGSQFDTTLDEASTKQSTTRQELQKRRALIKANQSKLNRHNEKLQKARDQKNKLKEESLKIQAKIQELCSLQTQLEASEKDKVKAKVDVCVLIESSDCLQKELDNSEKKREKTVEKNRAQIKEHQAKVKSYEQLHKTIQDYNKEILDHNRKDVKGQLEKLKIVLSELVEKKEDLTSEIKTIETTINNIKDEISNQQINKRDLDDNMTLRNYHREQSKFQDEICKIDEKVGELDEMTIISEKTKLLRTHHDGTLEKASTEGSIKKLEEFVKDAKKELLQPQFKNINNDFRKKNYDLVLLKAADQDLKNYSIAMDLCLMKFHKEKMSKINNIIRDMWRKIYRGNDIDYVEIRTDENEGNASGSKRMYDYRVVQRRIDTEIDMSGRCSAGQKVLASLIIRMALAETFSNRFGVLALDEPTTNLDRENVTSLCNALGEMVLLREKQKNFMFIIITHDAEFLQSLGRIDKLTSYLKVSRKNDGKSKINKVKLISDRSGE